MRPAPRILALIALLPLLLAACADEFSAPVASEPVRNQPVAFRLSVTGAAGAVLGTGDSGRIEVLREGADEAIGLDFANGAMTTHELPPGTYSIARIGPLLCRGLAFEVDPSAGARALGSLRAKIITTDYHVALMSLTPATGTEIAALAERTGTTPGAIDARPLVIPEAAPCFISRAGPDATFDELPLGEKIMLGALIGGFCALAFASGGFCVY
jgi:hypothetical protein